MAHQFSGCRLRDTRRQTGLSREQLAVRAGVSVSAVTRYEQGRVTPNVNAVAALAEVLSVELGELLDSSPGAVAGSRSHGDTAVSAADYSPAAA